MYIYSIQHYSIHIFHVHTYVLMPRTRVTRWAKGQEPRANSVGLAGHLCQA